MASSSMQKPNILYSIRQWFIGLLGDTKQKSTIASLDGVRAIACLTVMFFHINWITFRAGLWHPHDVLISSIAVAGASGVTLFFVLSGFLLFLPYAKAMLQKGLWPSTLRFYLRRMFRIIPAYYLSLFLMILFIHPEYLQRNHLKDMVLFLTFFMDSTSATYRMINGPFWTLAVEWQFYLILPLLALGVGLLARLGRSMEQRLVLGLVGILGIIAWGLGSRYFGIYYTQLHPTQSFLVPRSSLNTILFFIYGSSGKYLEDFGIGMLISILFVFAQLVSAEHLVTRAIRFLSYWFFGLGLGILLFMALWNYNQEVVPRRLSFINVLTANGSSFSLLDEIGLAIGFGLCVIAILFGAERLKRPFENNLLRLIGLISYSLYMWHLPFLLYFRDKGIAEHWNHYVTYGMQWVVAILLIIPFAFLFYLFVERPGMRLGEKVTGLLPGAKKAKAERQKQEPVVVETPPSPEVEGMGEVPAKPEKVYSETTRAW